MKAKPLKDKGKVITGKKYNYYAHEDIKSAVEWLKYYLRQRKKGHDSIKIESLLVVIDEAFEDVK